jgi:hypothetical protein
VPATRAFAPAARHRRAVSGVTPPSTSSTISRPLASIIVLSRSILRSCEVMKLCPPKPGLTVMTRIRSTSSSTFSIASGGVAGFSTTPALAPSLRICCSERERCGPASGWTAMIAAPASWKAARKGSAGAIIRCTSSGMETRWPMAFTASGPMVMLGTKRPSMTSTWSQSAPAASTAAASSPSLAKSAARIDAEMIGRGVMGWT